MKTDCESELDELMDLCPAIHPFGPLRLALRRERNDQDGVSEGVACTTEFGRRLKKAHEDAIALRERLGKQCTAAHAAMQAEGKKVAARIYAKRGIEPRECKVQSYKENTLYILMLFLGARAEEVRPTGRLLSLCNKHASLTRDWTAADKNVNTTYYDWLAAIEAARARVAAVASRVLLRKAMEMLEREGATEGIEGELQKAVDATRARRAAANDRRRKQEIKQFGHALE